MERSGFKRIEFTTNPIDLLLTGQLTNYMKQFGTSSQDSSTGTGVLGGKNPLFSVLSSEAGTGVTRDVHALKMGSSKEASASMASTISKKTRNWIPYNKRWRKELEELTNMEESKVMRVGGLTFVPNEARFRIALVGQTEVLLGLREDGTEVAIKKILKSNFNNLQKELEVLQKLRFKSRYVVQYVDSTSDSHCGYIAMQLCEFNLDEYIKGRQPADSEKKRIAREVLEGLKELHEKEVIHRDIKPHNVFIDTDERVRIADFGISRILSPGQTTMETYRAGTMYWEAREIIQPGQAEDQKSRYNRNTDIQVAGMLVYYILSGGKHPFGEGARCQTNILDGIYTLDDLKDEEAKDLVKSMININPKERPCITKVLEHPYFWEEDRKEMFLEAVGNVKEVEKYKVSNDENPDREGTWKSFSKWKTQLNHVTDDLNDMKKKWLDLVKTHAKENGKFPETLFCLLRFIRNRLVHNGDEMKEINVMKLFPDLVVTVYKCAEERNWGVKGFLPLASAGKRKADSSIPTQAEGQEPGAPPQRRMRTEPRGQDFLYELLGFNF